MSALVLVGVSSSLGPSLSLSPLHFSPSIGGWVSSLVSFNVCPSLSPFVPFVSLCFPSSTCLLALVSFCLLLFPFMRLVALVGVLCLPLSACASGRFGDCFHVFGAFLFSSFCVLLRRWRMGFWPFCLPLWFSVGRVRELMFSSFVSPIIFLALGGLGWGNCLLIVTCRCLWVSLSHMTIMTM